MDTLLAEYDYDVLVNGKRSGVTEKVLVDSTLEETRIDWVYDQLGRLTQESYNGPGTDLDFITDYVYDLVGNRLTKTVDKAVDETISYTYDLNDRLLTEGKDVAGGTADDRFTVYEYGPDANSDGHGDWTQQTGKVVHEGLGDQGDVVEQEEYSINLQGRMSGTAIDSDGDSTPDTVVAYEYGDDGIRTSQTVNGTKTSYLYDKQNPTGLAQVLEEKDSSGDVTQTYTLGNDVIAQQAPAVQSGGTLYLQKDGHTSTRGLVDALGQPLSGQVYRYDAFGIRLDSSNALTSRLYSGSQTDAATGMGYNLARYLRFATGTFMSRDPYVGNHNDPQSLHKHLYCYGDPVNYIDPLGLFIESLEVGKAAHKMISDLHLAAHGSGVRYGRALPGVGNVILPDIVNYGEGQIGEIKPLSVGQIAAGKIQLAAALNIANGLNVTYHGHTVHLTTPIPHSGSPGPWVPEDWQPGNQVLLLATVNAALGDWVAVTIGNWDGLILYKAIKLPKPQEAPAVASELVDRVKAIASEMMRDMRLGLDPTMELLYEYRLEAAVTAFSLTTTALWWTGASAGIETLRLRVMTTISGFNTFGTAGLAAAAV